MQFTKMLGSGRDFVFVDCFAERTPRNPHGLAVEVADRTRGIGAEALILIEPSRIADVRIRSYGANGDETLACGTGLRCVAKYLFDHKLCTKTRIQIEAEASVLEVDVFPNREIAQLVKVEMGTPEFEPVLIPTCLPVNPMFDDRVVNVPLDIQGFELPVSCLAMSPSTSDGTIGEQSPHCVVFVEQLSDEVVFQLGPLIEASEAFPESINVEFVELQDPTSMRLRTWASGVGEVISSGLGASAACVVGAISKRTERSVACQLPGGTLHVEWDERRTNGVYLTGSAVEVFTGRWNGLS